MSREQGFALSDFEYSRFAESWLREMSFFRIRFSGSGFRGMFFCRIRFAVYVYGSLVLLFNYLFLSVLLHLFPFNSNDGTAAGIKHLRRLQTGRTAPGSVVGPLACRLLLMCAEFA